MRKLHGFLIFIVTVSLIACSKSAPQTTPPTETYHYEFEDALRNQVILTKPVENVVSLYGSYSELWKLAGGHLIGVTDDVFERDLGIDPNTEVIGSTKTPNIERIIALQPDLVILNSTITNQVEIVNTLEQSGIPCAFFDVETFDDYLSMLKIATEITNHPEQYEQYGTQIEENIEKILTDTPEAEGKTVLLLRAYSTNVKARNEDNMTGHMLKDFKTINITSNYPSLLEELSMETIIKEDPDYIFVTTMGDSDAAIANLEQMMKEDPAWNNLTAIKNDRLIILPKDLFHYKPNNRWDNAYEYLSEIFKK